MLDVNIRQAEVEHRNLDALGQQPFPHPAARAAHQGVLLGRGRLPVTGEESAIMGGAGSTVNEWLLAQGIQIPVLNLGLPDIYVEHDKPASMLAECGLDAAGIERAIRQRLASLG